MDSHSALIPSRFYYILPKKNATSPTQFCYTRTQNGTTSPGIRTVKKESENTKSGGISRSVAFLAESESPFPYNYFTHVAYKVPTPCRSYGDQFEYSGETEFPFASTFISSKIMRDEGKKTVIPRNLVFPVKN